MKKKILSVLLITILILAHIIAVPVFAIDIPNATNLGDQTYLELLGLSNIVYHMESELMVSNFSGEGIEHFGDTLFVVKTDRRKTGLETASFNIEPLGLFSKKRPFKVTVFNSSGEKAPSMDNRGLTNPIEHVSKSSITIEIPVPPASVVGDVYKYYIAIETPDKSKFTLRSNNSGLTLHKTTDKDETVVRGIHGVHLNRSFFYASEERIVDATHRLRSEGTDYIMYKTGNQDVYWFDFYKTVLQNYVFLEDSSYSEYDTLLGSREGFFAAVFKDIVNQRIVIAYQGTVEDIKDAGNYASIHFDGKSRSTEQAFDFFSTVSNKYQQYGANIILTGHSQGGTLANYVTLIYAGVFCSVAFNAPTTHILRHNPDLTAISKNGANYVNIITHYTEAFNDMVVKYNPNEDDFNTLLQVNNGKAVRGLYPRRYADGLIYDHRMYVEEDPYRYEVNGKPHTMVHSLQSMVEYNNGKFSLTKVVGGNVADRKANENSTNPLDKLIGKWKFIEKDSEGKEYSETIEIAKNEQGNYVSMMAGSYTNEVQTASIRYDAQTNTYYFYDRTIVQGNYYEHVREELRYILRDNKLIHMNVYGEGATFVKQ